MNKANPSLSYTVNAYWYQSSKVWWLTLLTPVLYVLSLFYAVFARVKQWAYQSGLCKIHCFDVPVIVVGNMTVGGTGKTPTVIALVKWLKSLGMKPGIVSRGYGRTDPTPVVIVNESSLPAEVGDEPLLMFQETRVPVVVGAQRVSAAKTLLSQSDCNVIISDDGLQHYAMGRDIELLMLDEHKGLGNGRCIPAGPLRESKRRLRSVDWILLKSMQDNLNAASHWISQSDHSMTQRDARITNYTHTLQFRSADTAPHLRKKGQSLHDMTTRSTTRFSRTAIVSITAHEHLYHVNDDNRRCDINEFKQQHPTVHAVAGIAHPDGFFKLLATMGFKVIAHVFPDHHLFQFSDLQFNDVFPTLMTAKDAIKCRGFATDNQWFVAIEAKLDPIFKESIAGVLNSCILK